MRAITKGAEPPSLTAHRRSEHSNYANYVDKAALRRSLATEQRGLCCYCMGRIHNGPDTMKIEHWRCQANYPGDALVYRNLLGACRGGEGQPEQNKTCDTRKGNRDLLVNPADPGHHVETRIKFDMDGTIRADDPGFDEQLNEVLNLNHPRIKNSRKGVLTGLLEWWRLQKPVPKARVEKEIAARAPADGELAPYCQVTVWWLRLKLVRMA